VAAAASSTVPVWWFWWRVKVVRRVKVFWQSANGHLYGRFPEWMRRCLASDDESLKGWARVSQAHVKSSHGTHLSAALAHVRLLAGVDALVDRQRGPLDELLAAVGEVAHVRADATVNPLCEACQCVRPGVAAQAPLP